MDKRAESMRKGAKATQRDAITERANAQRIGKAMFVIGIDPGTNTGYSVWDVTDQKLVDVETLTIYKAISRIGIWKELSIKTKHPDLVFVRFEDAAKRRWFGRSGPERYKGAGSIERDCAIWREVLTELDIPFEAVAPQSIKGTPDAETFNKITGWKGRTSVHARDAAWMVYGVKNRKQHETI